MAPLNIAWLLQGWTVLGLTSYAVGARPLLPFALVPVFLWLFTGTALAQAARVGRGVRPSRPAAAPTSCGSPPSCSARCSAALIAIGPADPAARQQPDPARRAGRARRRRRRLVGLGAVPGLAARHQRRRRRRRRLDGRPAWPRRPARDELRVESSGHPAREHPASDFVALVRTDRSGIWRSVPMRRGMVVLALFPGLVAIAGAFTWDKLSIFPGLVASGGVLLFGVNSWCLDGRGALWRDSLPVSPRLDLRVPRRRADGDPAGLDRRHPAARLAAGRGADRLAARLDRLRGAGRHRAGGGHVAAVVGPQPVRRGPAQLARDPGPAARDGRLLVAAGPEHDVHRSAVQRHERAPWFYSLALAVPFLLWSGVKLLRTSNRWADPVERSRVIATVAS